MSDETRNSTGRDAVLALLTRLLVGAERRMDTLGDWVETCCSGRHGVAAGAAVRQSVGRRVNDPTPPTAFC